MKRYIALCVIFLFSFYTSYAQPANDNCANAEVITISNNGYGTGTFTSTNVNIAQATIQTGETFAPAILVAGQNQKSIWFKFTVSTTRKLRVTLQQPGAVIQAGDVGFAVYKTSNCLPAGTALSTKLTPIATFGNTLHPCVDSGVYLVQVSSKAATSGSVSVQIEADFTGADYDRPATAYSFGALNTFTKYVDFSVECQSVEDGSELCNPAGNFQQYTKSTWHTFTTPSYFDYISVLLASPTGSFAGGQQTVGYRLYKGDAKTTSITSLQAIGNCDSLKTSGYTPDYRLYKCNDLETSTTYSIQLFYKQTFSQDVRLAIAYGGSAATKAPEPISGSMAAANKLGTLPASVAGITTSSSDYLACNSRHSLHPCGDALPASGVVYNNTSYNLSTFYTFTLATAANIVVTANSSPCNTSQLLLRLYRQDVTNNCASLLNTDLLSSATYSLSQECLLPGTYTLQISGRDAALPANNYYYSSLASSSQLCLLSNLGQRADLSIRVTSSNALNQFSLSSSGAFDKVNAPGGTMAPLQNGVMYTAAQDVFGCSATVLPDTVCYTAYNKAMYRQFIIADSGLVTLTQKNINFYYKLYKGDANALATQQNKFAYPARITGLTPYSQCLDYYEYCQADRVCVTAGTYTFTTFGSSSNYLNVQDRPQIKFDLHNSKHGSPVLAQNMGSILDSSVAARTSDIDYFSCTDNAVSINGYAPCIVNGAVATKAIYRQFYLKNDAVVSIAGNYNSCNYNSSLKTLFSGKATDGLSTLQPLNNPWRCFYSAQPASCVTLPAGWYTVVSYGVGPSYQNPLQALNVNSSYSSNVGLGDQFTITVSTACPGPQYNRPYKASVDPATNQPYVINWDAVVTPATSKTLSTERFNCTVDTPFTTRITPCGGTTYNRVAYYVFNVVKQTSLQVSINSSIGNLPYAIYPLDVRTADSVLFRTTTPVLPCTASYISTTICKMQPGTYTLVVFASDAHTCTSVTPTLIKPCNDPQFNRPYKAAVNTSGQPFVVDWAPGTGHTAAYPKTDVTINLPTEYFNCQADTPFSSHPVIACNSSLNRVAYYVFKTVRESYVQINTQNQWASVYALDVRTDSMQLRTAKPIQPCLQSNGYIQLCRLPAGTYSLVLFANNSSSYCLSVTPSIYIDQPGYSRFDRAAKAYDFGVVPPDSTWYNGKPGDVNPLDAGRTPSNDIFYCTTGASATDPANGVCGTAYNPRIYSDTSYYLFNSSTSQTQPRRNLWYTFVTNQGGTVRVRVNNKTPGKQTYQYRYTVYKSNVDGTLPFSTVVSTGQVDSTTAQGLTAIVTNSSYSYCYTGPAEVTFYREPCNSMAERYYILVEMTAGYYGNEAAIQPNSQVEVSILIDSVNSIPPKFNHYSQAGNLGNVGAGTYTGATDNFTCATRDVPDPVYQTLSNCNKNLWYKFTATVTGNILFRVVVGNNSYYDYQNIQLFRQVKPGDSTMIGLQYQNASYIADGGLNWSQICITPGTYYLLLPGCNRVNENVYPQIKIVEQAGDFCSAPVVAALNGSGNTTASAIINCHTIGTDYGEFNPLLTCPANTPTSTYKSSWFRVDVNGNDTLDVTAYLNENTTASSSQIKYRIMTGNCGAMQEQSCVQDALTQNTYKCLGPGSYFFQVFTPVAATGTIDLKLNAIRHTDTCAPVNNCLANANFIPQYDCNVNDSVRFVNYSTYGSAIQYLWDFGYNGKTSTEVSPSFSYPALTTSQTYTVTLTSRNTSCNGQNSVTQTIIIPPRPGVNLGNDTTLCNGGTLLLNATTHTGTTYQWSTGSTASSITATTLGQGTYWVRATYSGCTRRDTIKVFINPIVGKKQSKVFCGVDSVQLSSARGYGETYAWSTGATNSFIYASSAGTYYCDIRLNGCLKRDTFNVTAADDFNFGNDTAVCIKPGQPYVLNALVSGAIGYQWQNGSTSSTFNVTTPGQYWVRINFGSCTIQDTVNVAALQAIVRSTAAVVCAGQSYTLPSGATVSTGGVYKDTLRTVKGCDSLISTVTLTAKTIAVQNTLATVCQGQAYTLPWGGMVTAAGNYRDTLRSPTDGCDSIIHKVVLTVARPVFDTTNSSICQGQSYTLPSGRIVNAAGVYQDTTHYTIGCDSLITTLRLTLKTAQSVSQNPTMCPGQVYTLPGGRIVNMAGTYYDTLKYVSGGCDSIHFTIRLDIGRVDTATINAAICTGVSYTMPSGRIVNTVGVYNDTLRHVTGGCDSIHYKVNVFVKPVATSVTSASFCAGQSYTLPSGKVVYTAGNYNDTLYYANGCDSLINTFTVTTNNAVSRNTNAFICAGQSYTLPSGIIVNSSGIYIDTLRYVAGCDSIITRVNLAVRQAAIASLSPVICAGQTYTLPSGRSVNTAGTFLDTLHYATGCDSARFTVNLAVRSVAAKIVAAAVCTGQSYILPSGVAVSVAGTYKDTLRYIISGCDSVITTTTLAVKGVTRLAKTASVCAGQTYTMPSGAVVNSAGVHQDTLHYSIGCDSIINTITLFINTSTNRTSDASVCQGQVYMLPWGVGASTTGTYRDTVRGSTGCDSIITIVNLTVKARQPMGINLPVANVCIGDSLQLKAFGGTSYKWIQGSGILTPLSANTWIYPPVAGTYKVVIADPVCNSVDTFQSVVKINPLPVIQIKKSNDVTCMQGSSQLIASGGSRYSWWPAIGLSNALIANPFAAPGSTTVYHVQAITDKNCRAEDSIEVKVVKGDAGNGFLVPSAFTPNGDGNNDCFGIRNWGAVTNLHFDIYDRMGNLIFSTTNPSRCWDGKYKGELLSPAAFVYFISATTFCGPIERKGTVTLIR